jgi:hypothetical protein
MELRCDWIHLRHVGETEKECGAQADYRPAKHFVDYFRPAADIYDRKIKFQ